jgi:uncharacterized membrane protein YhiD involved in acid resistance
MRERYPAANADPARICAQIVNGIGFLGSATVFKSNNYVKGINTAANLWICAAISMAIGAGLWEMALVTALFTAGVLALNNCYKRRLYLRMQEEQNELNAQQDLENPTEGKSRNNSNVYNSQYVDLESVGTGFDAMMGSSGTQERDGRQDRFVEMARLNKLVSNLVLAQELTKTESGNSGFETVSQGGLIDGSHEKTV